MERATDTNGHTQEERAREGVKWQLLEHKKGVGGGGHKVLATNNAKQEHASKFVKKKNME